MLLVADYAVVLLHCLRIYLEKSYRNSLALLSEIEQILADIGLKASDRFHHSTLVKTFDRLGMKIWQMLLHLSAHLYDITDPRRDGCLYS